MKRILTILSAMLLVAGCSIRHAVTEKTTLHRWLISVKESSVVLPWGATETCNRYWVRELDYGQDNSDGFWLYTDQEFEVGDELTMCKKK